MLPQSRRHAYIASLLGIPHVAVCINKMDLVDYSQARFEELKQKFGSFCAQLGFKGIKFIPISALMGDNVVHRSPSTGYYDGGTLLECLETVPIASDVNYADFRFPVQYVMRPDLNYRGFSGTIASGIVKQGDTVKLRWTSDRPIVLHLHGYDIERKVEPGAVSEMAFVARATGRFSVEEHKADAKGGHSHGEAALVRIEVLPR